MKRLLLTIAFAGYMGLVIAQVATAQDRKPSPLTPEQNKQIAGLQGDLKSAEARKRAADAEYQALQFAFEATVREFFIQNRVDANMYSTRVENIGGKSDVFGFSEKPKETPKPEAKPADKK